MMISKFLQNNRLILIGLSLIVLALILPADFAIDLRPIDDETTRLLMVGSQLFKAGLVGLGIWVMLLKWIARYLEDRALKPTTVWVDRNTWIALSLLIIVTTVARFYALNSGLWLDEILTYVGYATRPYGEIISIFDSENQHFLYSLLAHTSFLLFGESAWALRLPAALFGIGSILALFLFGTEITNKKEAFLSAALLSLSYHHIWFSQNARGYSGLLFWTILSSYYLLRGYRYHRTRDWVFYGVSAALGAYTHLTMGFVIFGQIATTGLAVLFERKGTKFTKLMGIAAGIGTTAILTYVLYALVLPQLFNTIGGSEQSVVTAWKNPLWTVLEILKGLRIGFANGFMAAIVLLIAGTGLFSYLKRAPIFLGIAVIPPIVGALVTILIGHHLWPRFFFFAFGFGALIVIRGVMAVGEWIGKLKLVPVEIGSRAGTIGCVGLIVMSSLSVPFAYGPKQDYLGALEFVQQNRTASDAVVTVSLATYPYSNLYRTDWQAVTSVEELAAIEGESDPTWLIYTFPPVVESVYPELMKVIESDYAAVKVFKGTVAGGDIFVCKSIQISSSVQPSSADR